MRSRIQAMSSLLAAVAFCVCEPAVAGLATYTSSADFFSALGSTPFVTEGYEGLPINSLINPGDTVHGITYDVFPAGSQGRIDNLFNGFGTADLALQRGADDASFFFPGDSMSITLPSPVTAIGIFFNVSISPAGSLFIQTPVGTATTGGPSYDQSTFYFAGLTSDAPFTTATIGGDATLASGFNLDTLSYAAAEIPVPEPGSPWMAGSGVLAGAAWLRRPTQRRRPNRESG